jgi:hypothetical protein
MNEVFIIQLRMGEYEQCQLGFGIRRPEYDPIIAGGDFKKYIHALFTNVIEYPLKLLVFPFTPWAW